MLHTHTSTNHWLDHVHSLPPCTIPVLHTHDGVQQTHATRNAITTNSESSSALQSDKAECASNTTFRSKLSVFQHVRPLLAEILSEPHHTTPHHRKGCSANL
ncbi:hypothetical protein E2C01_005500 [Portunus trituberculatus]|uniref:Uncharacterized protein n=1 Tax=Portunus trituberculatus TaxID=210409 RepID=A0A5B7CZB7_PORTR|nr:hypothetical protein [Portunus trituberculatus]